MEVFAYSVCVWYIGNTCCYGFWREICRDEREHESIPFRAADNAITGLSKEA